jgi:integrase/recombinase XerC
MMNLTLTQAQVITADTFNRFLQFIDRTEKTTQTYITNLRQFAVYLRYRNIEQPTRETVISYRNYLSEEHEALVLSQNTRGFEYRTDINGNHVIIKCKPNTVKLYLQSVKQFFKWTASEGIYPNIAENIHCPKVRQDTHKKDALMAQDVLNIENSIRNTADTKVSKAKENTKDTEGRIERATEQGKRLYAMYQLAVTAGLRTIELERANVKDIVVKNGNATLYIWGKGHSEPDQAKPLAPEVYTAIKEYLSCRSDRPTANSPLFVSTGNRSKGKRILARTISQMLKEAMKQAGYDSERITAHSLRHTAGTATMQITGNNIYETQKYMRHTSPNTTEIYLHIQNEQKESRLAEQIYNYYHGKSSSNSLESVLQTLSADQVQQLTNIAKAMAQ